MILVNLYFCCSFSEHLFQIEFRLLDGVMCTYPLIDVLDWIMTFFDFFEDIAFASSSASMEA